MSFLLVTALSTAAGAQTGPAPEAKKPPPFKYSSPLDTIMSTHLWTDVPATQPFVQATHPDPKTLDYTPLTGKDPDRPKPRDATNIKALQAELEADLASNGKRAHGLADPAKPSHAKKRAKAARAAAE